MSPMRWPVFGFVAKCVAVGTTGPAFKASPGLKAVPIGFPVKSIGLTWGLSRAASARGDQKDR